jgi:SAM-dependent methyltransferase
MPSTLDGVKRLIRDFADSLACPSCKESLSLIAAADSHCDGCGQRFAWIGRTWNLVLSAPLNSSPRWSAWHRLQANGLVSYREDPEHNLAVGDREDCRQFSEFCRFHGRVLDVGCGPQPWPAYFRGHSKGTRFVGVDPLIKTPSPHYLQLRALAEYLPFRPETFDQVVLATSLDHFVDPVQALREVRRVCRKDGVIALWLGEKQPGAPRPSVSPEWYIRLERPPDAEDVFHLKRLDVTDVERFVAEADLRTLAHERRPLDTYRVNHFYRLAP